MIETLDQIAKVGFFVLMVPICFVLIIGIACVSWVILGAIAIIRRTNG